MESLVKQKMFYFFLTSLSFLVTCLRMVVLCITKMCLGMTHMDRQQAFSLPSLPTEPRGL